MEIIFIGNYPQDRQESMERFTLMLDNGFRSAGYKSQIWRPVVMLGKRFKSTNKGIGKWLGYIDKWILFPIVLRWRLYTKLRGKTDVRFHICDHSNAPYLKHLPSDRTCITCHDVIAIRGGVGFADAYNKASNLGKYLQKWILRNLKSARKIAFVSQFTLSQLKDLVSNQETEQKEWRVIYNGFNADFGPLSIEERNARLCKTGLNPDIPFLLHVGSETPRKNRKLLLEMVVALGNNWDGIICYAGQALDQDLITHIVKLNLQDRVVYIVKPDHDTLVALYNACEAFVFPSFAEGFGWPLIEAQACGAPVIASNLQPMPEVSGGAALHADPTIPQEFANAFLSLKQTSIRAELILRGYENCKRFEVNKMINSYLKLHGLVTSNISFQLNKCF